MRSSLCCSALLGLVLAACGGHGSGGAAAPEASPAPLDTPRLQVQAQAIKRLSFRWDPVAGATHYRLFEDRDGDAGPQAERLLAERTAEQPGFTLADALLPARVNARYRLQACHATACVDAAPAGIEGIDSAIGYFKASNAAAGDEFGEGLALSGDGRVLAVGAHLEDGLNEGIGSQPQRGAVGADVGAVYVFRRGDSGWVQEAYLKPQRAVPGAQFGWRLALSGDGQTLLVGSPQDNSSGTGVGADPAALPRLGGSGAAYVFQRGAAGGWSQTHYIKPQAPALNAMFGQSISLSRDGQWAAVGEGGAPGGGAVSLYQRQVAGWVFQRRLNGSNTGPNDGFGVSLQLDADGDTLVVGADAEDGSSGVAGADNSRFNAGAAYVFRREAGDSWREAAYLKAPDPAAGGGFGYAVDMSDQGDTLVVGETGPVTSGTPTPGRVHVFRQQAAGWVHERLFTSPTPGDDGGFGDSVALSGDGSTLAIANAWEDALGAGLSGSPGPRGPGLDYGAVFLYRRDAAGAWSPPVYLKAPNNQSELYFGWSLALSGTGETLAVYGSDFSVSPGIGGDQNDRSARWAGAVYLY